MLIGSRLYRQLAFRQQLSHILSSYSLYSSRKGKVESRNQGNHYYQCYFIIGLQDRYGIGDSFGGAQLTMEEVWIVQTGNFTLNGLVLLLFCNFFGKVKVVLEPQDMLADLIRVLAFA